MICRRTILPLLLLSASQTLFANGLQRGMDAMQQGNYAEAYCQWKPLAHRGSAVAQYNLGWLYANGNGMNVNVQQAVKWWGQAASQGHADAQFAMGLAYTTGEGIKKDEEKAVMWYFAAAKQGNNDAREILVNLAGSVEFRPLELYPDLVNYPWFGRPGEIISAKANVREGSSTNHKIIRQLTKGAKIQIIEQKKEWLKIRHRDQSGKDAKVGWVHNSLVQQ